ncbi:MAG TPA: NfeD family protein [Candidatus Kapabacteria bacterium]|nr:NfeD family protein [Candidatus Kapabacteria bacterium]
METFAQNPALWWLSAGVFMLVLEVVGNTLFFLWFSGAMFVTALVTWLFGPPPAVQGLVFAIATVFALLGWQRFRPLQKMEGRDAASGLNNRLSGFVGRELVLTEAVVNGQGRVHIDDTYWVALGEDMPAGTRVRVVGLDGMRLRLERI